MARAPQFGRRGDQQRYTKPILADSNQGNPNQALKEGGKDWYTACVTCGATPTVHPTKTCGPCCFGDASTRNGNW